MRNKTKFYNVIFRRRMSLSLLVFFLLAQTVTLWHAEIHPFHEHDELCEVFENLEKLPVIIDTAPVLVEATPAAHPPPTFFPRNVVRTLVAVYDARAPPF